MANSNRMPTVPALTLSMLFMLLAIVPLVLAVRYPKINQKGGFNSITNYWNSEDGLTDVACAFAGEAIHKVLGDKYPIRSCNKKNVTRRGSNQAMVKLSIKKNNWPGDYDCTVTINYSNNGNGLYTYKGNDANVQCKH